MILFLDASALVKRYVNEARSDEVRDAIATARPVISRLSQVEVASALARRFRDGSISASVYARILDQLHRDLERFDVVELTPAVATQSEGLLGRHPLRASDATQLASCLVLERELQLSLRFLAYDERLTAAAAAEGLVA